MKKEYIKPTMNNHFIVLRHVIANSPLTFNGNGGEGQLMDEDATGASLGRRSTIWDDDDEE